MPVCSCVFQRLLFGGPLQRYAQLTASLWWCNKIHLVFLTIQLNGIHNYTRGNVAVISVTANFSSTHIQEKGVITV